MKLFRNVSIGVKLNLLILLVLSVLFLGIIVLLGRNTQSLTKKVGSEQLSKETNIIESRLTEVEKNLTIEINFLASSVNFFQAVGRRSSPATLEIITQANASLGLDDIEVVDGDGNHLVDLNTTTDSMDEDALLKTALSGSPTSGLIIGEEDGEVRISIGTAVPVVSATGNILGAVQFSRRVDDAFLDQLTFGDPSIHLGLVYSEQVLSSSTNRQNEPNNRLLINGILLDAVSVQQAQTGQTVVLDNLITGDNDIPHAVAYTPVLPGASASPAVIMIVIELENIASFQNQTQENTIGIFLLLTLIALIAIYFVIYQTTISPLNKLRRIAQDVTSGQYAPQTYINTKDEVGQLATAFNEMADAIQQREVSLLAARERAELANQVKSSFLAAMSHELRTPLNAILNLTKLVAEGLFGEVNAKQVDMLGRVVDSGDHLLNLINDLLDISKIEAGSLQLFIEDNVNLGKELESIVSTAESLLKDKNVKLIVNIEPDMPTLKVDRRRIRQIMLNIVSNACKFTKEGSITIDAHTQNNAILMSVTDTGPGIAPEEHAAVFEIFSQTKSGLEHGGGTGLGMPISKRLAEAHGGNVWLDSELGKGTTFYVSLPVASY